MPSRIIRTSRRVFAAPFAASLLLFAGAAPALADDSAYAVELRQDLPRTATSTNGGVPQESHQGCPGVPEDKDGWHFVLPGNDSTFVKLTVTFEPGGRQVITDFGPPTDKHAYAVSEPGARLVDVEAEVRGGSLELFNLSHTCPADSSSTTPEEESSGEPTEPPTDEPAPGDSENPANTSEPTPSEPSEQAESSQAPQAGGTEGGQDGDLAETGGGAPVGAIAAGAAVLLGAGGYLVLRRRKATAHQG